MLNSINTHFSNHINHVQNDLQIEINFEKIKDFRFGHLTSNTAMQYAKRLGMSPMQIADNIKISLETFEANSDFKSFSKIEMAVPGFVNITLSKEFLERILHTVLQDKNYGNNQLETNKLWAIEHTSPNPNKAMHIGHLRNNLVGMSLSNLLIACGATVTREAIMNDRGIAIAKLMYGYLYGMIINEKSANGLDLAKALFLWTNDKTLWHTPASLDMPEDLFITECYIKGENFSKTNETDIRQMVIDWEAENAENHALWKYILNYSYIGMNKTLTRLDSAWDNIWYESEHYKEGKDLVEQGVEKNIFQKLEDGAVLTNLVSYNIPDTILQKRDGTSLYITQDLALTQKKKTLNKADKLVWIVGPDQSLAMKQMFACCEQLGIGTMSDFWHITYGYVGLSDKAGGFMKMSSRSGNVLLIDDVINTVKDKIQNTFTDISNEKAEMLSLAAVKFAMLKSSKDETLTFDLDNSIDTKGDTGIYVLYTLSRIKSVLDKASGLEKIKGAVSENRETRDNLLRSIFFYPLSIEKSYDDKSAHHIAQYLLEICSSVNRYYEENKVIIDDKVDINKLEALESAGQVIEHALNILNIKSV